MTCSSKVTISLEACRLEKKKENAYLFSLPGVNISFQWFKSKLFIHPMLGFYGFSVPEDIHVQLHTNQTGPYFWVKDREKAVHVHIFTDELEKKKKASDNVWRGKAAADQVCLSLLLPFALRWETLSDRKSGSHRGGFSVCSWWRHTSKSIMSGNISQKLSAGN